MGTKVTRGRKPGRPRVQANILYDNITGKEIPELKFLNGPRDANGDPQPDKGRYYTDVDSNTGKKMEKRKYFCADPDEAEKLWKEWKLERTPLKAANVPQLPAVGAWQMAFGKLSAGITVPEGAADIDAAMERAEKEYRDVASFLQPLIMGPWTDATKANELRYLKWRIEVGLDTHDPPDSDLWHEWVDARRFYDMGPGPRTLPFPQDVDRYMHYLYGDWMKRNPGDAAKELGIPRLAKFLRGEKLEPRPKSVKLSALPERYKDPAYRPYPTDDPRRLRLHKQFRNRNYKHQMEFNAIVGATADGLTGARFTNELTFEHFVRYNRVVHDQRKGGEDGSGDNPYGAKWLNAKITATCAMFFDAVRLGVNDKEQGWLADLARNRLTGIGKKQQKKMETKKKMKFEPEQFRALVNACGDDQDGLRMRAMMLFALNHALTVDEVFTFERDWIDFDNCTTQSIRYKSGEGRAACLDDQVMDAINDYLEKYPHEAKTHDGELLLFAQNDGKPISTGWMNPRSGKRWKALVKTAGLDPDKFNFNMIRKTAKSAAVSRGHGYAAELVLGHVWIGEEGPYTEPEPESVRLACAAICDVVLGITSISIEPRPALKVVTSEGKRKTVESKPKRKPAKRKRA